MTGSRCAEACAGPRARRSWSRTPYAPTLIPGQTDYQFTTQSLGSSIRALDWLTFRVGASTGFRAPTATELGANFTTAFTGNVTFGNPGLQPESSRQIEAGATVTTNSMRLDASIFKNTIHESDHHAGSLEHAGRDDLGYRQQSGDIIVQGIELQSQVDILKTFAIAARGWAGVPSPTPTTISTWWTAALRCGRQRQAGSHLRYEAAIGRASARAGAGFRARLSLQIIGNLRGPMWYNTEERLLLPGQLVNVTVYRKSRSGLDTRYEVRSRQRVGRVRRGE